MEEKKPTASPQTGDALLPIFEWLRGGDPDSICSKYRITREELNKRLEAYQKSRRQMALADQLPEKRIGRNEPCPCGSGKKYKKCCLPIHEEARKNLPADHIQQMEQRSKLKEKLEKEIGKGFDLLFSEDYGKARSLAARLLETYPEDDRLHDIMVTCAMAEGDYDSAFHQCRRRWQVAAEEKEFYQENGYHKREGADRKQLVYFYSPSTWLEKFWIAQRARTYRKDYPVGSDSRLQKLAKQLKTANDTSRFPVRQEEGYQARKEALAPVMKEFEESGPEAIPYLLPLAYTFSWASLFVPDILFAIGTDDCIRLLAELSMFRFPFFAQKCLVSLEKFGEKAVPEIRKVLSQDPAFDELKIGQISVLGNIHTPESFAVLVQLTEHESPYVVSWAAEALAKHKNPKALPYLERAKERLGAHSKIAGAIKDLVKQQSL